MLLRMSNVISQRNSPDSLGQTAPETSAHTAHKTAASWRSRPIQLIIVCGIILLFIVIAITAGLLSNLRDRDLAEKARALESLTLVLAEQIDRSFQSIELVQTAVIERMRTYGVASAEDFERQMSDYDTYERLKDTIKGLPYINAIVLTDAEGKLINFSRSWPIPSVTIPGQDPSRVFKSDPQLISFVGKPLRSPVTGNWVVSIARKLTGPNGEFLGVIQGAMELRYFEQLFKVISSGPNGSIALFQRNGLMLVRYPRQETAIGQFFPQSRFLKILAISDHGTRRQVGVIDGQERLISARNLAHYPVAVVATTTVADALANWKRGAITMVVTALIAGLVIGSTVFISIWMVGRRLREQSLQRDAALNNMSQGLAMFDSAGQLVVCNDRYRKMYDFPPDLVRPGCKLLDLLKYRFRNGSYPSDPEEYVRDLPTKIAQGKMTRHVVQAGDGRIVTVTNRLMTNGGWVATHEDITEAKRQEEALARANQELIEKQYAIDQAVTVAITDVKGDIIYVNDNFCRISGYSREELLGNNHRILNSGTHPNTFFRDLYHKITNGHVWRGEVCNKAKNGSLYWVDTTIVPQLGSDGKPVAYMAIRVDITARKLAEEKISYMANHDALTGVGNRALLYEKLGEVLARLRRHQETFTVLLLDLDGFKHINDTLGHAVGDNLLKELAGRLNFALRETDTLTRLGGDEFAIIQHNETNQREAAITLAVRLLEIVSAPFHLEGHDVTVGASIGVSIAPEDGIDAGELIQKADLALYRVKSEGRNNFRFFDAEMSKSATERLRLLADMRAALAHKEFELHYQPVFDTKTLRPCGVEALVRWRHPTDGLISPDRFIALAEETGLMEQLGDWI